MNMRWLWQGLAVGLLAVSGTAQAQRSSDMPVTSDPDRYGTGERTGKDLGVGQPTDREGSATATFPQTDMGRQEAGASAKAANVTEDARVVAKLHHINTMEIDVGKQARDKGQSIS